MIFSLNTQQVFLTYIACHVNASETHVFAIIFQLQVDILATMNIFLCTRHLHFSNCNVSFVVSILHTRKLQHIRKFWSSPGFCFEYKIPNLGIRIAFDSSLSVFGRIFYLFSRRDLNFSSIAFQLCPSFVTSSCPTSYFTIVVL